jgi:hypothetical protein
MDKPSSVLHYTSPRQNSAATAIQSPNATRGRRLGLSFAEADSIQDFEERYPEFKTLTDTKARRAFVAKIKAERTGKKLELKDAEKRRDRISRKHEAIGNLFDWSQDSGMKIERPDGPSFRIMRKAVAEGHSVYLGQELEGETPALDFEKEVFRFAEIIVIEHDWTSAFQDADLDDAVVKLPYDVCAFEFKFSGRPVIALATQFDQEISFTPAVLCGDLWVLTDFAVPLSGFNAHDDERNTGVIELLEEIGSHIRAACIALDAEVARSDVMRETYSSVHGKNVHQPLKPYHVVSLARRARPLSPSPGTDTGRRVRLHFRRGHWRHFEAHKTWIKWMLVGDPDLGFVDKHYRL